MLLAAAFPARSTLDRSRRKEHQVMAIKHRYFLSVLLLALCVTFGLAALWGSGQDASANVGVPRASFAPQDGTEPLPPGVTIDTLLPNMTKPIAMAFDPAGRLFYTEKETGLVRLYANGTLQASPVITYNVDGTCSERGLLGIAIDPNFNANHYIYVFYTQDP